MLLATLSSCCLVAALPSCLFALLLRRVTMTEATPHAAQQSGLQTEWWPLEKPIPYARNSRVCPESAIAKVAGSLAEFGFRQPIVVDENDVIIAGHTRLLAAQRLGLAQVPVHVATDLSPEQVKAYRLMDNRSAQETSWDLDLLPLELSELAGLEFDLSLTGFEPDELAAFLAGPTEGLTDPDAVPEPPEEPVSKTGDLYLLGKHRLLCGDSTSSAEVERLMAGKRASLMATDPPYLVDYQGGAHPASEANEGAANRDKHWDTYIDHEHSVEFYVDFLRTAVDAALTDDAAIYQWFGIMRTEVIWQSWREVGLLPHQVLVWLKSRSVLTYSHFMWNYEPMMYGWRQGHMPKMKPPADAKAVWEIGSAIEDGAAGIHPTQKPVETIKRPIAYHTKPGGLIYEPFSGSGTALIAAEETGRVCYAMEQSPQFVDVAVTRWERFTGKKAAVEHG
jgi:DNA modification methylase